MRITKPTVTERSEHIAEWVRLTEERNKLAQVAPVPGNTGGINAATRELGIDCTEAQRAVKITALPPEVKQEARARSPLSQAPQQPHPGEFHPRPAPADADGAAEEGPPEPAVGPHPPPTKDAEIEPHG